MYTTYFKAHISEALLVECIFMMDARVSCWTRIIGGDTESFFFWNLRRDLDGDYCLLECDAV
jgi:hypothetical protein